jgi:hypothetical protein
MYIKVKCVTVLVISPNGPDGHCCGLDSSVAVGRLDGSLS